VPLDEIDDTALPSDRTCLNGSEFMKLRSSLAVAAHRSEIFDTFDEAAAWLRVCMHRK